MDADAVPIQIQLTDDFNDGDFAGWTSSTFGSPGSVTAANGRVEFSGPATSLSQGGIVHDVVADGNFEASADFLQNGADGSRWRHGIELTFANGRVVFHDADGPDKGWYLYGNANTPVWSGNPSNSAGIEGESAIKIRRTGDHFVFDVVRAGVESYLASYDFADLGDLVGVQSRAWAHDAVLDVATDNFRLVPIGSGNSPTESFTDDFANGLGGWEGSFDGTGGGVSPSNGGVALQGAASDYTRANLSKNVSVAGDFAFSADLAWLGSSGAWRQGLYVNFGSQSFLIHDSGEAGWYIYGPGGTLFAGYAGGTSGQSGPTTLSIERTGDVLTFGFTRGGTFTSLFTTTQTGLGTLTQVGIAAWSHGIDLNSFADNASLIVG